MIFGIEPVSMAKWAATSATAGGSFGAIFFGAKWLIEFLAGRTDKRADRLDAATSFVIDQLRVDIARLHAEREEDKRRLDEAFRRLDECQRQHAEASAEVMQLRAMMQGYGDARDRVQAEQAAARLPHHPIAVEE